MITCDLYLWKQTNIRYFPIISIEFVIIHELPAKEIIIENFKNSNSEVFVRNRWLTNFSKCTNKLFLNYKQTLNVNLVFIVNLIKYLIMM